MHMTQSDSPRHAASIGGLVHLTLPLTGTCRDAMDVQPALAGCPLTAAGSERRGTVRHAFAATVLSHAQYHPTPGPAPRPHGLHSVATMAALLGLFHLCQSL
jgi:hypothetical protein